MGESIAPAKHLDERFSRKARIWVIWCQGLRRGCDDALRLRAHSYWFALYSPVPARYLPGNPLRFVRVALCYGCDAICANGRNYGVKPAPRVDSREADCSEVPAGRRGPISRPHLAALQVSLVPGRGAYEGDPNAGTRVPRDQALGGVQRATTQVYLDTPSAMHKRRATDD